MNIQRLISSIFTLLLLASMQGQNITATVSKNPIRADEKVHFTITLKNIDGSIAMPDLKDFSVMSGPNQTSRFQNINGVQEQTYQLSWLLYPKRKGTFTINPIPSNGGLTYDPVTIEVTEGMAPTEEPIAAQRDEVKDHFAKIYLSNTKPYQGEQITATYVIYNRIRGFNPTYDFANTIEGFWTEDLDVEPRWQEKYEEINGYNYQKAIVRKQILFPQKTGELIIEPFEVEGRIRVGWGKVKNAKFKSNRAIVNVKKLPPGAPDNFKGAVGAYDFDFNLDKTEVETDEAFNVTVNISGKGNLSMINELPISFPNDFEVYDPEIKDNIGKTASGMAGSRSYEYLVIPRHSGNYEIDGISFSYFNPKAKRYITESSEDLVIKVKKDPNQINSKGPSISRKEDVAILENDIRFISKEANLNEKGRFFFGSAPYTTGLLSPALGFFLFMFFRRRKQNELSDVIGTKKRKAGKFANKRLEAARVGLNTGNISLFYEELHTALSKYLNDKINLNNADFTKDTVKEELEKHKVSQSTIDDFIEVLNNCEMARYAPSATADSKAMMLKGEEIINALEEEIA